MALLNLLLYALAIVGHAAWWTTFVNRVHATAWPKKVVRPLSGLAHACTVSLPFCLLLVVVVAGPQKLAFVGAGANPNYPLWLKLYLFACCGIALGPVAWSMWRRWRAKPLAALRRETCVLHDLSTRLGPDAEHRGLGRVFLTFPGNEVLQLDVNERTLVLPRLPAALEGLTIAHLSDLHFTGRIAKQYFLEAVDLVNQMQPDVIAITGDLVERTECIDWIADTLGRLRSRYGTYFVLGNHDIRINVPRLRETLLAAGMIDVGGRWLQCDFDGRPVILAGNELPWIKPAADMSTCPHAAGDDDAPLRILLSHSPDEYAWARERGFDLMLAGHTHGGQIVLPLIGALISPSKHGTKYACGVFHEGPTVMHVSRGLSGELPIRWNCPPEVTRIVLTGVTASPEDSGEHQLASAAH